MRNQFVYTETVEVPAVQANEEKGIVGADAYTILKPCSFNTKMVIRTITLDDERLLVLLSDIHERQEEMRKVNPKNGRVSLVKERNTFQSEITLSKEDGERFLKITNIEE